MSFQLLDDLRARLDADDGGGCHDQAELDVHVAERAMFLGGDDGFSNDVREVGAHDEIHRHTEREQGRSRQEASPDAKEAATDSDNESDDDQVHGIDVGAGDQEIHGLSLAASNDP